MAFEDFARVEPSILECHIVSGEDTHLLKIRTDSPASLRDLLARLREFPGIARTVTSISLCTIKESGGPPLPHPETDAGGPRQAVVSCPRNNTPFFAAGLSSLRAPLNLESCSQTCYLRHFSISSSSLSVSWG
jgi:hypothetical protein